MLPRVFKATLWGTLIGLLPGVLAGGLSSALIGKPFSGTTGLKVFHLGMVFPGLVIFAPATAGLGAVLDAGIVWFRKFRDERG